MASASARVPPQRLRIRTALPRGCWQNLQNCRGRHGYIEDERICQLRQHSGKRRAAYADAPLCRQHLRPLRMPVNDRSYPQTALAVCGQMRIAQMPPAPIITIGSGTPRNALDGPNLFTMQVPSAGRRRTSLAM